MGSTLPQAATALRAGHRVRIHAHAAVALRPNASPRSSVVTALRPVTTISVALSGPAADHRLAGRGATRRRSDRRARLGGLLSQLGSARACRARPDSRRSSQAHVGQGGPPVGAATVSADLLPLLCRHRRAPTRCCRQALRHRIGRLGYGAANQLLAPIGWPMPRPAPRPGHVAGDRARLRRRHRLTLVAPPQTWRNQGPATARTYRVALAAVARSTVPDVAGATTAAARDGLGGRRGCGRTAIALSRRRALGKRPSPQPDPRIPTSIRSWPTSRSSCRAPGNGLWRNGFPRRHRTCPCAFERGQVLGLPPHGRQDDGVAHAHGPDPTPREG